MEWRKPLRNCTKKPIGFSRVTSPSPYKMLTCPVIYPWRVEMYRWQYKQATFHPESKPQPCFSLSGFSSLCSPQQPPLCPGFSLSPRIQMDHYASFCNSLLLWFVKNIKGLGMRKQTSGVSLKALVCLMSSTQNHLLCVLDSILFFWPLTHGLCP